MFWHCRWSRWTASDSCVCITENLSWCSHSLVKKAHLRIYHLRHQSDFRLPLKVLKTFYTCTIDSLLTGGSTWSNNALQRTLHYNIHKIKYSWRLNVQILSVLVFITQYINFVLRMLVLQISYSVDKIKAFLDNPSHPLYNEQCQMGSSFSHWLMTQPSLVLSPVTMRWPTKRWSEPWHLGARTTTSISMSAKQKELIVDHRKTPPPPSNGTTVERVSSFRFLWGSHQRGPDVNSPHQDHHKVSQTTALLPPQAAPL